MLNSEKQHLFSQFLSHWSKEFRQVEFIIRYLKTYPELLKVLKGLNLMDEKNLIVSQLEWVSLVYRFDNPIESEFFKQWYVPLNIDFYEIFIDLSSPDFTIFEANYFSFEPYQWIKKVCVEKISDLLVSVDDKSIDIDFQIKANESVWKTQIDDLLKKRKYMSNSDETF
jgi:hypothetical protein